MARISQVPDRGARSRTVFFPASVRFLFRQVTQNVGRSQNMNIPNDLKYTQNDEWLKIEGKGAAVGITDYAQNQLSDIVYVEIVVSVGDTVKQGEACATLESVKAAADVYMPAGGKIVAINEALPDKPETVNKDPYGEAWMVKVEISDPKELDKLMNAPAYEKHLQEKE
jgi:glycine cleavage system H protein